MKTSELTGAALDWAVAKIEGVDVNVDNLYDPPTPHGAVLRLGNDDGDEEYLYQPSTDWAQGGPIIERESMALHMEAPREWHALQWWDDTDGAGYISMKGSTPLIAAMRCYVASKLGYEIEIPEEIK